MGRRAAAFQKPSELGTSLPYGPASPSLVRLGKQSRLGPPLPPLRPSLQHTHAPAARAPRSEELAP